MEVLVVIYRGFRRSQMSFARLANASQTPQNDRALLLGRFKNHHEYWSDNKTLIPQDTVATVAELDQCLVDALDLIDNSKTWHERQPRYEELTRTINGLMSKLEVSIRSKSGELD
jgi:hypothetical protein